MVDARQGLFKANGPNRLTIFTGKSPPGERIVMTTNEMNRLGKDSMDMAAASVGAWTRNAQAIAVEVVGYSKKSFEGSAAAWEKLLGAKTLEKAAEVQSEYLKASYEDFMAEATKLGQLYADLAKEAYRPFEGVFAKSSAVK
jgi:hypothetical protein